jgi:hypothetical protein
MGSSKRKRQSTDSAIADMSSGESCTEESQTQAISQQASTLGASVFQDEESQPKRHRGGWTFDVRDFGTAASQRPRRGTASKQRTEAVVPQSLPQEGTREVDKVFPTGTQQAVSDEVNGNNEKRRQTPRRKRQAPAALPTPPQTAEKNNSQSLPQESLRRSTRERRPTERSRQASIQQESPCKKKTRGSTVSATIDRSGEPSATVNQRSCLVRLRVRSSSTQPAGGQMSFTGSFSHRQRSSQEQDSQPSRDPVGKL